MSINDEKVRMHRLPIYRVALVREGSQPSILNSIKTPRNVFEIASSYLEGGNREQFVVMNVRREKRHITLLLGRSDTHRTASTALFLTRSRLVLFAFGTARLSYSWVLPKVSLLLYLKKVVISGHPPPFPFIFTTQGAR